MQPGFDPDDRTPWLQGKFVDFRMHNSYSLVKALQDLACADRDTAALFMCCCGFSNLCSAISWPPLEMRHARWAAVCFLKEVRVPVW